MTNAELREYHKPPEGATAASPRPECLGCNDGYVFYTDRRLAPQTVQLYNDAGQLLATIPNVRDIYMAPLRD